MIVYPPRAKAAADRKRLIALEARRARSLYRDPPPERVAPPISLPAVSMSSLTDEDVGLKPDPVAQMRAETYLRCAIATRLHDEDAARRRAEAARTAVHVEVDDDALHVAHVTDHAINLELQRIAARPPAKWMRPGQMAS